MQIRSAAVAGSFYPKDRYVLSEMVNTFLLAPAHYSASLAPPRAAPPKALIVPHAGYIYSGQTAAQAYKLLSPYKTQFERVLLLGPAHRVALRGVATSSAQQFDCPLGRVQLDREAIATLEQDARVQCLDLAHAEEHSLEVQLPFLKTVLGDFSLIPLVVGDASEEDVSRLIEPFWQDDRCLVVVSTDLSHYHSYTQAQHIDRETSDTIMKLQPELQGEQACGCRALNALLSCGRQHQAEIQLLDLCNSGDTAGSKDRVVGYAAYALY